VGTDAIPGRLKAAVGVPVAGVRSPLTTFREIGCQGQGRVKRILAVMVRANGKAAAPVRLAAE